jgi:hypothetical protein
MSFVPQFPIDPSAVIGNFRVNLQNSVHAGEHVVDVTVDALSDIAHHTTALANGGLLSFMELQQSLLSARTCSDSWTAYADHGSRLRDNIFKYFDECSACRQRAMSRLHADQSYADA